MNDEAAANYKALHNKLNYMKRCNKDPAKRIAAQDALEQLVVDKEEMINKWMQDQSLQWITTLKKSDSTEACDSTSASSEWLNRGQMIRELAMQDMSQEMQDSELDRYVNEPHPNPTWAAAGEKQWKLLKITEVTSTSDKTTTQAVSEVANKKRKVEKDATNEVDVVVNYKAVCRKGRFYIILHIFLMFA